MWSYVAVCSINLEMNITDNDLQAIMAWAKKHPEIRAVYLFGSRARGDNQPDSDIDLAVRLHQAAGDEEVWATWMFWYRDYQENPDLHLSNPLHLEWYEPNEGLERVGPAVESYGMLLYSNEGKE